MGGGDRERQGGAEKAQAGAASAPYEEGRCTDYFGDFTPQPFADGDHVHNGLLH